MRGRHQVRYTDEMLIRWKRGMKHAEMQMRQSKDANKMQSMKMSWWKRWKVGSKRDANQMQTRPGPDAERHANEALNRC